jgi:hypothetical protein
MLTHFRRQFSTEIKSHRLIFRAPETADVIKNVQDVEKLETVVAVTLDDNKYLFKESGKKGEIKKYMDGVNSKIDKNIPAKLQIAKATAEAGKYTPDAMGAAVRLSMQIPDLKEGEKWSTVVSKLDFQGALPELVQAIKKAKDPAIARQACDDILLAKEEAETNLTAAKEIDEAKKQTIENVKRTAEIAVEQKQKLRFEAAKKDFVRKKVNQLFPDDPKADQQKLQEKRMLATTFLESGLGAAELKADKKEIQEELDSKFKGALEQSVMELVKELTSSKEKNFMPEFPGATPEVKAYLGGILASMVVPDGNGGFRVPESSMAFVTAAYMSIPENKRNYLPAVKEAMTGVRQIEKFELKREEAIAAKILEIFPDDDADSSLKQKREIARAYLTGLLSSAEMQTNEKWTKKELDYYMSTVTKDWFTSYIQSELEEKKATGWRARPELKEVLSSTSPAANAYMEGLIDSFSFTNEKGETILDPTHLNWIVENFKKVPEDARHNVDYLKTYFNNQPAIYFMDENKHPEHKVTRAIFDEEGYSPALSFYDTRMVWATETFSGKAGGSDVLDRYRAMLLSEIGKQDPANLDLDKLNALPMPWAFEAKAVQVGQIPEGAIAAGELPKGIKEYANRLSARTGKGDLNMQFEYDGHLYYMKRPPNKIYIVPETKAA